VCGTGTDEVFRRSFSALDLSVLAALDNEHPFLSEEEFARLLSSTLAYLAGEKDLRAFDVRTGWMHATAHTADVLKFLGRNPRLRPADQRRILDGIAAKARDAGLAFTHGENERLAAAVMSLVLHKDLLRSLHVKLALRQPPGPEPARNEILKTLEKLGA
jgi:hypothetical protein